MNEKLNMKEQLNRRKISFLNFDINLLEGNNLEFIFKNLDYPYIESV